jgi:hypothetical protein
MKQGSAGRLWLALNLLYLAYTPVSAMPLHGEDNRFDLYEISDESIRKLADSTVLIVQKKDIAISTKRGTVALKTIPYTTTSYETDPLCPEEHFFGQPRVPEICSGALVSPDTVLTAGHCLDTPECGDLHIVFGFSLDKESGTHQIVPTEEVYACKEVLLWDEWGKGHDRALLKLDRKVKNHAPLRVNRGRKPSKGTPVFAIGHPMGLPTKVSGGIIRVDDWKGILFSDIDAFSGNSGSSVFNAETGEIVGIISSGREDFTFDRKRACWRSKVFRSTAALGTIIEAAKFRNKIPRQDPQVIPKEPGPALKSLLKLSHSDHTRNSF